MNNVIIQGFNALRKLIGRGYAGNGFLDRIEICKIWVTPNIDQVLSVAPRICQEVTNEPHICQSFEINGAIKQILDVNPSICQKVSVV